MLSTLALLAVHARLAPMHLGEVRYIGALFLLASVLLVVVAAGLVVRELRRAAWWFGAALSIGMAAAYVISRTIGLPHYHESWKDMWGTTCLALEAVYLVAMGVWMYAARDPDRARRR